MEFLLLKAQTTLPRNVPRDEKREEMAVFTGYRLRIPVGKLVYSYHHPCNVRCISRLVISLLPMSYTSVCKVQVSRRRMRL